MRGLIGFGYYQINLRLICTDHCIMLYTQHSTYCTLESSLFDQHVVVLKYILHTRVQLV